MSPDREMVDAPRALRYIEGQITAALAHAGFPMLSVHAVYFTGFVSLLVSGRINAHTRDRRLLLIRAIRHAVTGKANDLIPDDVAYDLIIHDPTRDVC